MLASSALFLQSLDSVGLVVDFVIVMIDTIVVTADCVIIFFDFVCVVFDFIFKPVEFAVKIDKSFSNCLKSNHNLSFRIKSLFI